MREKAFPITPLVTVATGWLQKIAHMHHTDLLLQCTWVLVNAQSMDGQHVSNIQCAIMSGTNQSISRACTLLL
jgi:hypothetical protein